MARLASAFGFPLGGEGLSEGRPWVINMIPEAGAKEVSITRPVRFSFRDSETYIDPALMLVEVGYAKSFSFPTTVEAFDNIPRTKRGSLQPGILGIDPILEMVGLDGIRIEKNAFGPQRSIFATAVDAPPGSTSAMVTAVVKPDPLVVGINVNTGPLNPSVYPGSLLPLPYSNLDMPFASGTLIGMEHGPSNKAVYVFFEDAQPNKKLRLTSYIQVVGSPLLNIETFYNWAADYQRYTLVWNEAHGYLEVYADFGGETNRMFKIPLSSIPEMPADYFGRFGTANDVVGVYGQEGAVGDRAVWKNIAVTTDVGYPVLGNVHPGTFRTTVLGSEIIRTTGAKDPRDLDIGTWRTAPESLFSNLDSAGSSSVSSEVFRLTKNTPNKTYIIYREEPGFLRSNADGFMVQAKLIARNTTQDQASTGMGIIIYDGRSIFHLTLFKDFAVKTVGLRKKFGVESDITQYLLPSSVVDWSENTFRFVVDPRTSTIKMYILPELSVPVMEIPFNRDELPDSAEHGWEGKVPFIAFGHLSDGPAVGTLDFYELSFSHMYQEWDGRSDKAPTDPAVAPQYTLSTTGSPVVTVDTVADVYRITAPAGSTARLHREAPFSVNRGGIIEARLRITSHRSRARTGIYLVLDDGNFAYSLTFVDTNIGKFVALSKRDGLGWFKEIAGKDGDAAKLSFAYDWSEFHTYRLERIPYGGLRVYVDMETSPRLTYEESDVLQLPDEQFSGVPSIAFGQFIGEGATSEWSFVRGIFGAGYEISFKKNKIDRVLRDELFATQAIVVAYAQDTDV